MGPGRRGAPVAPPIPSRPLPPAAYGIGVPGAPVAAGQQYVPPPPAQYVSPQANPFAAPPLAPNPFAAPQQFRPAPVGKPGQWVPTGVPHRIHPAVAVLVAVVASFLFVGILAAIAIPSFLAQRVHHIGVLPVTVGDATQLTGPAVDAQIAQGLAANPTGRYHINQQQFGIYSNGTAKVVMEIGALPSGAGLNPDDFFAGVNSSAGDTMHSVDNAGWTGATRCGVLATTGTICVWVDNGTVGLVLAPTGDEASTLAYLQDLRSATERL